MSLKYLQRHMEIKIECQNGELYFAQYTDQDTGEIPCIAITELDNEKKTLCVGRGFSKGEAINNLKETICLVCETENCPYIERE